MGTKHPRKVYQGVLRTEWVQALLAKVPEGGAESFYNMLEGAKNNLQACIAACQQHLANNPLTPVVAQAAAQESGRGGQCSICVDDKGAVLLEIQSGKGNSGAWVKRPWVSSLPSLKNLQEKAAEMGLEIKGLGRSRRKYIHDDSECRPVGFQEIQKTVQIGGCFDGTADGPV